VLDAPKPRSKTLLPRAEPSDLVQRNLSELHSAPGRQAASLIRTTHLRSLAFPLSAVATATSLAETNPAVAVSSDGKPWRYVTYHVETLHLNFLSFFGSPKSDVIRKRSTTLQRGSPFGGLQFYT
jgi:hypothetical protein